MSQTFFVERIYPTDSDLSAWWKDSTQFQRTAGRPEIVICFSGRRNSGPIGELKNPNIHRNRSTYNEGKFWLKKKIAD